jgi:hypothetical protein
MRIAFVDATEPVRFNLDDIMIINNTRPVVPAPRGLQLVKTGLDYTLTGRRLGRGVTFRQESDALWRQGGYPCQVQVVPPDTPFAPSGENIKLLGPHRVPQVDLVENNPIRLRLVNIWYFPARTGEWASLAVRQVRWEHTFYGDGRWVTHVELNNSGGEEIGGVRIGLGRAVALWGATLVSDVQTRDLVGPIGRWSYLWAPWDSAGQTHLANYLRPAAVKVTLGQANEPPLFDPTQGCYRLTANAAGHCHFTITPTPEGLRDPVFRVAGRWEGDVSAGRREGGASAGRWEGGVSVNAEGLKINDVARLSDGSVLFTLPGLLTRPTSVEVTGKVPPGSPG